MIAKMSYSFRELNFAAKRNLPHRSSNRRHRSFLSATSQKFSTQVKVDYSSLTRRQYLEILFPFQTTSKLTAEISFTQKTYQTTNRIVATIIEPMPHDDKNISSN